MARPKPKILMEFTDPKTYRSEQILDADAIFMYKTIGYQTKNPIIVTELATINAIAFIEQDKGDTDSSYYSSKPFAAGEIFISHLLDSLMC